ncbi:MAG: bifunctional pyr operon transcriptional regulator/uracil phosphoribosyltransferase PyrR [Spirosomataceae bacterium]
MAQKRKIVSQARMGITLERLAQELIENHGDFQNSVLLGLQPRGVLLVDRLAAILTKQTQQNIQVGYLDATFYRDDFRRRTSPLTPNATKVPFIIENKQVILCDDVIASGRMVRAAMDALQAFGRPTRIELVCLIDRKYNRDIPIQPDYVGQKVNTLDTERVRVVWNEQDGEDAVWLEE